MAGILFPICKKENIYIADMINESNLNWTIVRFMVPKCTHYSFFQFNTIIFNSIY
ncbi:protein of unknown function [Clostridium beijerinckii]|nr:protein of unknown function [Clostridium beijerinckii]